MVRTKKYGKQYEKLYYTLYIFCNNIPKYSLKIVNNFEGGEMYANYQVCLYTWSCIYLKENVIVCFEHFQETRDFTQSTKHLN